MCTLTLTPRARIKNNIMSTALGLGLGLDKRGARVGGGTSSIIALEENWNSGTIDSKWTLTNTNNFFSVASGELVCTRQSSASIGIWTDSVLSVVSASSDVVTARCNQSWSDEGNSTEMQHIFALYVNSSNYITTKSRFDSDENYYLQIIQGGSSVYALDSGITNGKDIKIVYDVSSSLISFWYWSGAAWTQMGTTQNYDIGSSVKVGFSFFNNSSVNNALNGYYDNVFLTTADFSTQYPT